MATSASACVFCICTQRARQFAQAYSNDRRSHCVRAKKFIAYARSQPKARHEEGMPVRRLWPEKSPARAWLHLRQLQHARRRGKGTVMSLIGTYWRRCLSEGLLCANSGRSKFDPAPGSMSAINRCRLLKRCLSISTPVAIRSEALLQSSQPAATGFSLDRFPCMVPHGKSKGDLQNRSTSRRRLENPGRISSRPGPRNHRLEKQS